MTVFVAKVPSGALSRLISPEVVGTLSDIDKDALVQFLSHSDMVWAGMRDETICGFWGIIFPTLLSNRAYMWLHTTDALKGQEFVFVRHSQMFIKELLVEYPLIVGHCLAGEPKSQRWLEWLGAEFQYPEGKFVPFEIRAA